MARLSRSATLLALRLIDDAVLGGLLLQLLVLVHGLLLALDHFFQLIFFLYLIQLYIVLYIEVISFKRYVE